MRRECYAPWASRAPGREKRKPPALSASRLPIAAAGHKGQVPEGGASGSMLLKKSLVIMGES
jgi:hypothetical protein